MSLDEELAQKLHEEEQARFNAEQEAKFNVEQEELLASETTEDEANPPVADIDWDDVQAQIQADEDLSQKLLEKQRKTMCTYMKNMAGYKMEHFKGKSFYEVKDMFDNVYKTWLTHSCFGLCYGKERNKTVQSNFLKKKVQKGKKTGGGSENKLQELKAEEMSQGGFTNKCNGSSSGEVYVEALQEKDPNHRLGGLL
ncbi:hypothetical protein Tco_1032587 [Tanacetum coccineum]|uniref:Uncharacterized protein n=1 Tax=Tanacetum coccineum TaxID=301880 RepID=A0ABQ5GDN3_9ASTR